MLKTAHRRRTDSPEGSCIRRTPGMRKGVFGKIRRGFEGAPEERVGGHKKAAKLSGAGPLCEAFSAPLTRPVCSRSRGDVKGPKPPYPYPPCPEVAGKMEPFEKVAPVG